jgi:selenocysteine lyase/cysteine desulfurase
VSPGRKSALAKLRRPWFSGGTITVASVQGDKHYLAEGESAFEDGTLDYLAIPAVEIGSGASSPSAST